MKAWAITVILAAVISGAAALILPRGEQSPLYQPLRFLGALILLLLLCRPLQGLIRDPGALANVGFAEANESDAYDPEAMLLERSMEMIRKRAREAFPSGSYKIEFETDQDSRTILAIRVVTADRALGEKISLWLTDNGLAVI